MRSYADFMVADERGIPRVALPSKPEGEGIAHWWRVRRWKRLRNRIEYDLFCQHGIWTTVEWSRVKDENQRDGVWGG